MASSRRLLVVPAAARQLVCHRPVRFLDIGHAFRRWQEVADYILPHEFRVRGPKNLQAPGVFVGFAFIPFCTYCATRVSFGVWYFLLVDDSSGCLRLGHAQTGFAIFLTQLGIVKSDPVHPHRDAHAPAVVALGPSGKEYAVVGDTAVALGLLEGFFEKAASHELRWPTSAAEIPAFAATLQEFAVTCRSFRVQGEGLVGGRDCRHRYLVKHFLRAMLFRVETYLGPDVWDGFSLEQLLKWSPDQESLAKPLKKMSGLECRKTFSVSPLLLSCWLCLADDIDKTARAKALALPHTSLWKVVREYERLSAKQRHEASPVDPAWPPGPRILAGEAAE